VPSSGGFTKGGPDVTKGSQSASAETTARRTGGGGSAMALLVIASCQLMVVLDITIVNIALPHIQTSLAFSTTSLSWVVSAYTLTFGEIGRASCRERV